MAGRQGVWKVIGPGLLFSGVAVGVSHLVQSTKAGAFYGLALVGFILAVNIIKYPSYRFGVDYGKTRGRSLLHGYRQLTRWGPILFCLAIVPSAPIIIAAVAATTAGIFAAIVGSVASVPVIGSGLLILSGLFLALGGFSWLDRLNRVLLVFLLISTVAATALALPRLDPSSLFDVGWIRDPLALIFLVALAGFMPNPLDASVIQSIWIIEAEKGVPAEKRSTLSDTRLAFAAPYVMTTLLALCFCIMGAGVMHGSGMPIERDAVGFAHQVINLYRETLGPGPAALASVSALSVMLTTMLAVGDVYSRMFTSAYQVIGEREERTDDRARLIILILLFAAAIAMLFFLMNEFGPFIDLATSIAFLSAPLIAILNHLVVTRCDMPEEARPSKALRLFNIGAIAAMGLLALSYFLA